jgi:hypothetical protein
MNLAARKKNVEVECRYFGLILRTAIVGLPGEIFAELGLSIKKRSPFKKHTCTNCLQ